MDANTTELIDNLSLDLWDDASSEAFESDSEPESDWEMEPELLHVFKTSLKLPLNKSDKAAKIANEIRQYFAALTKERAGCLSLDLWSVLDKITSQIPHDSELHDVLADAFKIIEQEGGPVWLDADGKSPFLWSWDQLPGLGIYTRDFFDTPQNDWSSSQMAQRRNYGSFLARLEKRNIVGSLMTVWEFLEALEGGKGPSKEGNEALRGPAMQTNLCMVRDRIVISGQEIFNHLRHMAAQDAPEYMIIPYQPGVLCDGQTNSYFSLSRWLFWKQRLSQIRDEQLNELGLVEDEVVPIINETLDRMEAIESGAGPIEGDNWPKLLDHNKDDAKNDGKQKRDVEGKQDNEKNVRFEEETHADQKAVSGGWFFSCVVS
ncbi:hypothetical protein MCOR25_009430 [Pyricularia grisea]|nr:hypothetical protein MCOR25_009430 [Pyricularia grisea]